MTWKKPTKKWNIPTKQPELQPENLNCTNSMQKKQAGYHLLVDTYLIQLLFSSITFFVLPFLLKHYRANRL